MKLDVESLRALRAVVETGTFTEAAGRLGMTQSAVSWKIKRLEERVGLELVDRGQEVQATADGEDLLHYAARVIDAHDEAVAHLSRSDLEGVIRLATSEDLRRGDLADVLARFGRMFPHVRLEVRVQLSRFVRDWFDDGSVDLAIVQVPTTDVRPDDVELWREKLVWVHGVGHDVKSAAVVPVVSFGSDLLYQEHAEQSLGHAGLRWRTVLECPTLAGVQAALEAGLGIAALNLRNVTGGMEVWQCNDDHPLPELCEVIRIASDGDMEVLGPLRDALLNSPRNRS